MGSLSAFPLHGSSPIVRAARHVGILQVRMNSQTSRTVWIAFPIHQPIISQPTQQSAMKPQSQ